MRWTNTAKLIIESWQDYAVRIAAKGPIILLDDAQRTGLLKAVVNTYYSCPATNQTAENLVKFTSFLSGVGSGSNLTVTLELLMKADGLYEDKIEHTKLVCAHKAHHYKKLMKFRKK